MSELFKIPKYAEKGDWPIFVSQTGNLRQAGDNYGEACCPFCDKVVFRENEEFRIGDKCWNCGAKVEDVII